MTDEENIEDLLDSDDKVADLLNEASLSTEDEASRLASLRQIQSLILVKNPDLLDNFLDEILQFQIDQSPQIKNFVVGFIEEACKKENSTIFQVIDNFRFLLYDDSVRVQKTAFYAMIQIYKSTLRYLAKTKSPIDELQEQTWYSLNDLSNHITAQLDSDNDGVRTAAIKFIEMLIIVLSAPNKDSLIPTINQADISIDQIPEDKPLLDKVGLIEEGRQHMRKLLEYTMSNHISSVNLIASISVLANIGKQRTEYMKLVLDALQTLLANMPPTLGKSQVATARKAIKLQLLSICKSPIAFEFQKDITSILSSLGASTNEITRAFPKTSDNRKRLQSDLSMRSDSKRPKASTQQQQPTQIPANSQKTKDEDLKKLKKNTDLASTTTPATSSTTLPSFESVVEDLILKLNVQENVADLVMVSMAYLPDQMPAHFHNSFKPISAAGTTQQKKSLAQMLAFQLNEAGLLNFNETMANKLIVTIEDLDNECDLDNEENEPNESSVVIKTEKFEAIELKPLSGKLQRNVSSAAGGGTGSTPVKPSLEALVRKNSSHKQFKLSEVTSSYMTDFSEKNVNELLFKTYNRILNSEETVSKSKEACLIRKKIIVETTALPNYDNHLTNYIFEDARKRIDLGLMWIFNNYLKLRKAHQNGVEDYLEEESLINKYDLDYDRTLYTILFNLQQRQDPRDFLFSKIICQVPLLTENCLKLLKSFCQDEKRYYFSMSTLRDLIVTRLAQRQVLLHLLLEFTHNKSSVIRTNAISISLKLREHHEYRIVVEKFALDRLKFLVSPTAPAGLLSDLSDQTSDQWTEDSIKSCLYLYLDLMPVNNSLIHPLSQIYIGSIAEVKRVILKNLETPIKSMGMASDELLKLIEEFPRGAETFVLRIIHILTEKNAPSTNLVNNIRELYAKRLPDVRFLIPVLTGLTKKEVITALPQLIKLSQAVVKEVFNRLLGINVDTTIHKSPITPADLLSSLHQIDPEVCDLKTIIAATNICFAEKTVYTQETLATCMQQLIDITPIPTLYMRTVIQSVTMYPKLTGFVLIMMQRLIGKAIWKYPKVWEGFIKCCQRIKPVSHQLLLQLPRDQLKEVLITAPDLKIHLAEHSKKLTPQEKSVLSDPILQLIDQLIAGLF